MKTTRRSFFAWLAAPIVARFAPKPLPVSGVAVARENGYTFYRINFERKERDRELLERASRLFAECHEAEVRMRQEMLSDLRFVDCIYPDGTRKRVEINAGRS